MSARARIPLSLAGVRRLAAAVIGAERAPVAALSIAFVGPVAMRGLNRRHLGHDRVTDVVAFGLKPGIGNRESGIENRGPAVALGTPPRLPIADSRFPVVGDLYICPAVAAKNAARFGVPTRVELRRLIIHGILHILGHDHPAGADRTASAMWHLQERHLARFGRLAR